MKRLIVLGLSAVAIVAVMAIGVGTLIMKSALKSYDRVHSGDYIDTIPVIVRVFPGERNEQILKGSSLIGYMGEPRLIVSAKRGIYSFEDVSDFSSSIGSMQNSSPYCVELPKPRNQFDGPAAELIDKAVNQGLVLGCGNFLGKRHECPSPVLSGIKNHPFTATVTETDQDSVGKRNDTIVYKIARDVEGSFYKYETQEEDGVPNQQFEIRDSSNLVEKSWIEGQDTGTIIKFDKGTAKSLLLSDRMLGKKQMESYEAEGHDVVCAFSGGMTIEYRSWSSEKLASYLDLTTVSGTDVNRKRLSNIRQGEEGLNFFEPPTDMKFNAP